MPRLIVSKPSRKSKWINNQSSIWRLEDRITPNNAAAIQLIQQIQDANAGIGNGIISVSTTCVFDVADNGQNALPIITRPGGISIGVSDFSTNPSSTANLQIQGNATPLRFFRVADGSSLTLRGVTFRGGNGVEDGAAINVEEGGALFVIECSFVHNFANDRGGAVFSDGRFEAYRSTFGGPRGANPATTFGNSAAQGSAVFVSFTGTSLLENCTVSSNIGTNDALRLTGFSNNVRYCTVTENFVIGLTGAARVLNSAFERNPIDIGSASFVDFCFFDAANWTVTTNLGPNNIAVTNGTPNSGLAGLSLNTGRTLSRVPREGSQLIDAGSVNVFTQDDVDQRQGYRYINIASNTANPPVPDIGAVEFQNPLDRNNPTSPWIEIIDNTQVVNPKQTLSYTVVVRNLNFSAVNFGRVDVTFKHRIMPRKQDNFDPNIDENFASRFLSDVYWWTTPQDGATSFRSGTGAIREIVSMPANSTLTYHVTVNIPGIINVRTLQGGQVVEVPWEVGAGQIQNGIIIVPTPGESIIVDGALKSFGGISPPGSGSMNTRDEDIVQSVAQNPVQPQAPVPWSEGNDTRTPMLRFNGVSPTFSLTDRRVIAIGSDKGRPGQVVAMDAISGDVRYRWFPFPGFTGDLYVATGDVVGHGDGTLDVIVAAGPGGGPHIKVYNGATGFLYSEFFAFGPGYTRGVTVAAGDLNGDGRAEVITGAGSNGTPQVRAFVVAGGAGQVFVYRDFLAYNGLFRGGITVAAGDVNGDGLADIVTGPGPGGGPHVKVFSGWDNLLLTEFFAYNATFRGGVNVTAGDVDNAGTVKKAEVITAPMSAGGPHVRVFSPAAPGNAIAIAPFPMVIIGEFFAADAAFHGGIRVGVADRNGDGILDVITSTGPGTTTRVKATNKNGVPVTTTSPNGLVPPLIPFTNVENNGGWVA